MHKIPLSKIMAMVLHHRSLYVNHRWALEEKMEKFGGVVRIY